MYFKSKQVLHPSLKASSSAAWAVAKSLLAHSQPTYSILFQETYTDFEYDKELWVAPSMLEFKVCIENVTGIWSISLEVLNVKGLPSIPLCLCKHTGISLTMLNSLYFPSFSFIQYDLSIEANELREKGGGLRMLEKNPQSWQFSV